jgi:hypothetical protein
VGEWENIGQSVQAFSYKINKFWVFNIQHDCRGEGGDGVGSGGEMAQTMYAHMNK